MKHTFFRAFKFAFQDFWRNIWLSLVTVTVLVLALLSVNVLISLNAISNSIINSVEKKVDISVFFKENVTEAQVDNFQEKIKSMSEVEESVYISKEKALADFREKHRGDKSIMEALRQVEENPLLDALVIRAKSTDDYSRILSTLSMGKNQELIKYQNYTDHKKIIEKVSVLRDKVKTFSISLT
ncbi:MAG TPA: permease-like cell division protein FtsX, partial [Patescibacteria group bacterium]|nr:permease-like cell division protein FtsX [Patescibacteria group bacterium]